MEKKIYKVAITYVDGSGMEYTESNYMRLTEGEKKLLYWLDDNYVFVKLEIQSINQVEIIDFN